MEALDRETVTYSSLRIGNHVDAMDHFLPTLKEVSDYVSRYDRIYYYEHFSGDPRSVFMFETGKAVMTFEPSERIAFGNSSVYFSIESGEQNETSSVFDRNNLAYDTTYFRNQEGRIVLKMYVLRGYGR
jgi:hypothetical protein